jgi:hypothetical protein
MGFFSGLKKKSREQELEVKVNSILTSISGDVNDFTNMEQVTILAMAIKKHIERKTKERDDSLVLAEDIEQSLIYLR